MSSHFSGAPSAAAGHTVDKPYSTEKLKQAPLSKRVLHWMKQLMDFRPNDPSNPNHARLRTQLKFRIGIITAGFLYFAYQHPEYSVLSAWWHGSNRPLQQQRFERLSGELGGKDGIGIGSSSSPLATERQMESAASIMRGSLDSGGGGVGAAAKKFT